MIPAHGAETKATSGKYRSRREVGMIERDSFQQFLKSLDSESRINATDALQGNQCPRCGKTGLIESWTDDGTDAYVFAASCRHCPFDSRYPSTWPDVVPEWPEPS